jgi:uncharacterized protein DUF3105
MKGRRRLGWASLGLGLTAAILVACGDTSGGNNNNAAGLKFVGNSTCPTASASPYSPMPPDTNGSPVGQAIDEMPHIHVAPPAQVQYNHDPPTSGCHYSIASQAPIQPGAYTAEIPAEYWVHNLEHGYIAVLYNCPSPPGCDSDFQKLVAWRKTLPPDPAGNGQIPYAKVIILPWHTMKVKFAAVSWDYYQGWDTLDIGQVQAFYANHVGHSPEGAMTG